MRPPALILLLLIMPGCGRPGAAGLALCDAYRPHLAKRTFDGRVGTVLLRNSGGREVEVRLDHPDRTGDVAGGGTRRAPISRTAAPGVRAAPVTACS